MEETSAGRGAAVRGGMRGAIEADPAAPAVRVHAALDEARLTAWGERVGRSVPVPLFVALRGDLGAGKSTLARAVARGAGVRGSIPSPTYNLLLEYHTERADVRHLDLFRLEDPSDVWELGWEELGTGKDLVLVEWPDRVEALLPRDRWDVTLAVTAAPDVRVIEVLVLGAAPPVPPLESTV
jgi:tRNA threonylcarbamoyladenosine biosynthesis protein TsaE